jgi:hypothetical protein
MLPQPPCLSRRRRPAATCNRILVSVPAIDRCEVCNQTFGYSLTRCPLCRRTFCESCAMRRGGIIFCGPRCAHAFYYGEEDEEDLPESEAEE